MANKIRYSEHDLQVRCASYLLKREREIKDLAFCHIPNEGKHKVQYRKKLREEGLRPGAPDLMIWLAGGKTLAVELKIPTGEPSDNQISFGGRLARLGHDYHVLYGESPDDIQNKLQKLLESAKPLVEGESMPNWLTP